MDGRGVPWQSAVIWKEPAQGGSDMRMFGLGRIERLVLTLRRFGIGDVHVAEAGALPPGLPVAGPVLIVRGVAVIDPRARDWLVSHTPTSGRVVVATAETGTSALFGVAGIDDIDSDSFDAAAGRQGPPIAAPAQYVCEILPWTADAASTTGLWRLSSKPTERWTLRQTRRLDFPITAALANAGILPDSISWASFWVALAGGAAMAFGGYAGGIAGALLFYLSWLMDTLDGAVSRLTFRASEAGAKLDTLLGRLAYLVMALSLAWAAFGAPGLWARLFVALAAMVAGGILEILLSLRADRLTPAHRPPRLWRIRNALEYLLHRDNALAILACAIAGRLDVFVWLAIVVVHLAWVVEALILIRARR